MHYNSSPRQENYITETLRRAVECPGRVSNLVGLSKDLTIEHTEATEKTP